MIDDLRKDFSQSRNRSSSNFSDLKINDNSECSIKINQIVNHKIFGKGKVVNLEGMGPNTKFTIMFFNNTKKKLIYKYANLEIVS